MVIKSASFRDIWLNVRRYCSIDGATTDTPGGMENVVCRAQAKVPVVAIYDPVLKVSCDMNINNTLALRNTKLVKTYMQIDERARQLTYAVKQWAAVRALNEAGMISHVWLVRCTDSIQFVTLLQATLGL